MAREKVNPAEMSVEEKLKRLYELQSIVSEMDRIRAERGELPLEVRDLEDEVERLTTRIEKTQAEMRELSLEIAGRKKQVEEASQAVARYEQQLDAVSNNREYDTLRKEIEYQRLDMELGRKKTAEAEEALAKRTEEATHLREEVAERRDELKVKSEELEEKIEETREKEDKLRLQTKTAEAGIEPRLVVAFRRIRKNVRNGLAVVYVERDACGGCFNKIPPQRQLDIRMRKKIIVCEYCGRIMVDPELAGVEIAKPASTKERPRRSRRTTPKTETPKTESPQD